MLEVNVKNRIIAINIIISENLNFNNVHPKFTVDAFVTYLSSNKNLKEVFKLHSAALSLSLKNLGFSKSIKFVNKHLLFKYNHKFCFRCCSTLNLSNFNKNKGFKYSLNCYCKTCHNETNAKTQVSRTAKYRSSKIKRTPTWSNLDIIKLIYNNCPDGYHVDHILPLNGDSVCGLHVENNLQYLKAEDNIRKSNKYIPE